jgi:hypothetical protein
MKRAIVALFLIFALPAMACSRQVQIKRKDLSGEFQTFWTGFREAVLRGDKAAVESMTQFPFKTRGILDSDPVKTYDQASFDGIYEKLLAQDTGLSPEPETMRHLIERTKAGKGSGDGDEMARVGNFVFQKIADRWCFTQAYMEE